MIVSHDSGFLDAVCTNIVHYQKKQLVYYQGNLATFVLAFLLNRVQFADLRISHQLRREDPCCQVLLHSLRLRHQVHFPSPGFPHGCPLPDSRHPQDDQLHVLLPRRQEASASRRLVRRLPLLPCRYRYVLASSPVVVVLLADAFLAVGPNGAGKSTLIKLLTGETLPDIGRVEKHPNLRVAYVAQHAFHHIEEHLEKTASQYIQWRYQDGHDKEQAAKATRALTPDEQKQMDTPIVGRTGESRKLERLVGRQKLKKSYTYEVKWQGMDHKVRSSTSLAAAKSRSDPRSDCRTTFTCPARSSSTSASPSSFRSSTTSRLPARDPDRAR